MSDKVITKMNKYMCVLGLSWETILCTFLTTGPWNWKDSGGWCTITSYCVCWKRNAVLCLQFSACPEKLSTSKKFLLYWLCQSLWLCGSQQTGKFLKRWEYQTTWPDSWEIWMQVKKQQLELDMKQWTGSKLGKEDVKAVYCPPAYLTFM